MNIKNLLASIVAIFGLTFTAPAMAAPPPASSFSLCLIKNKLVVKPSCPKARQRISDLTDLIGPVGPTGPAGPITSTLPSGVTLRGFWTTNGYTSPVGGDAVVYGTISFGLSLVAAPAAHYIALGQTASECPGSADHPEALAGHLCVYEDGRLNVSQVALATTAGENLEATFGAIISVIPSQPGFMQVHGTWAVTAP